MVYEIAEMAVKNGTSMVFKSWRILANITEDDFLSAIKWLCEDPQNGGTDGRLMTREIGLTPNGIVKLRRVYENGLCSFYYENGKPWNGVAFRTPCPEKYKNDYADEGGMFMTIQKISLSVRDRI